MLCGEGLVKKRKIREKEHGGKRKITISGTIQYSNKVLYNGEHINSYVSLRKIASLPLNQKDRYLVSIFVYKIKSMYIYIHTFKDITPYTQTHTQ